MMESRIARKGCNEQQVSVISKSEFAQLECLVGSQWGIREAFQLGLFHELLNVKQL